MKRIYILVFVLLATGFTRSDASVTPAQDPAKVNSNWAENIGNTTIRLVIVELKKE